MRVLIAEDDPALASFVKKGLEAEHYAVDVSVDGEQARSHSAEFDYDMVVLDLNLPRLDGVAILRFLRSKKPSVPILVLTGRNRVEACARHPRVPIAESFGSADCLRTRRVTPYGLPRLAKFRTAG